MSSKVKKEVKAKGTKPATATADGAAEITSREELKAYLQNVRDKLRDEVAPPIFALSSLHHIMELPQIYDLLDNENKEIARDIWLRLKASGLQVKNPPLLFSADEDEAQSAG